MSAQRPLGATAHGAYELPAVSLDARGDRTSARNASVALGGVVLAGGAVALAAAHTAALRPESIRLAVPGGLAGAFAGIGLDLHAGGTIAALALMFACYALVVAASGQLSARAVLGAIAALYALILLAPPLISTDVFSYQSYARMGALYATNPYTHGPYAVNFDVVFPYVGAKWSYIPTAYGPVFTVFSYLLAPLSVAVSAFAYKSLAALAGLGLVAIVWHCARLRRRDPVRAVALVGLNPLLVVYGIGGGHNDLVMLLAMAGGVYALLCCRERWSGALLLIAAGIKLTAGLVAPFALAAGGARRGRGRRELLSGAAVGAAVVAAVGFGVFGTGSVHMLATLNHSQSAGGWQSIPGFIASHLGAPSTGRLVGYLLAGGFLIVCGWLLARVWRGQMDWLDGAAWAMLAMLAASSSLLPWYVSWLLPLAALAHDRRLVSMTVVLTGIVLGIQLLGFIPHGSALL